MQIVSPANNIGFQDVKRISRSKRDMRIRKLKDGSVTDILKEARYEFHNV